MHLPVCVSVRLFALNSGAINTDVGADMPSIHATKISTIERSCVKKVLQNRDSESTRLRNTTEDNTTKTSPVEGYSLILSLTQIQGR